MALLAGAVAGSSVLGAGASLLGSGKSSGAAKQAAGVQQQMYQQTAQTLAPFVVTGAANLPSLTALSQGGQNAGGPDYLTQAADIAPGTLTNQLLNQTPGYQWMKQQGIQSVNASNAARGLGVSGAQMKGAASYVTGLAQQSYMNQFNMQQQQFQNQLNLNQAQQANLTNQFNRLLAPAQLGEAAGAQTGQIGAGLAAAQGNFLTQAGLASAAGTTGAANALSSGAQNYLTYNLMSQYMNPAAAGGGTGGYNPATASGQANILSAV